MPPKPSSAQGKKPTSSQGKKPKPEELQQPVEEVKQEEQIHIETEGLGRFEYVNGTVYEGQWKLINGQKMKYGWGKLVHGATGGSEEGSEWYEGYWENDLTHGKGTYHYTSGAIYSGTWVAGKQEGTGLYEFPNGAKYEGEWKDHRMHGEGVYTDIEGRKWEGEFVEGVYKSKLQKQLKMEKLLKKKETEIFESSQGFFKKWETTFAASDKKTFKENLLPFFAVPDEVKQFIKEPYPKYEDRTADKWNDSMKFLSDPITKIHIPRNTGDAKLIDPSNILVPQFSGFGQIVEFHREAPELKREAKLVICNVSEHTWVIVSHFDTAPVK